MPAYGFPFAIGVCARKSLSAFLQAVEISASLCLALASTSHVMAKFASGLTEPSWPSDRTWPYEANTVKSVPRYLLMVLALAGDSTTTIFVWPCSPPMSNALAETAKLKRYVNGDWHYPTIPPSIHVFYTHVSCNPRHVNICDKIYHQQIDYQILPWILYAS